MAKPKQEDAGIPDYMVTFADLMSILVCFFVLIISFSTQDDKKLQVVAGSMKDAFGVQLENMRAGIVELDGSPVRKRIKHLAAEDQETDANYDTVKHEQKKKQGPEANTHDVEKNDFKKVQQFALAAASLRQAWQEMPEITEMSDQIQMEETKDGLNIRLMDRDGRPMFPRGAILPYSSTQRIIEAMAPALRAMPNRIKITGHTDANKLYTQPGRGLWEISTGRALATRNILAKKGLAGNRFYAVGGRADTDPLFPEDPMLASNRRITILIMNEAPNMPPTHKP